MTPMKCGLYFMNDFHLAYLQGVYECRQVLSEQINDPIRPSPLLEERLETDTNYLDAYVPSDGAWPMRVHLACSRSLKELGPGWLSRPSELSCLYDRGVHGR